MIVWWELVLSLLWYSGNGSLKHEQQCLKERLYSDSDFAFFKDIHDKIKPHRAWSVAYKHGHLIAQCKFVISLCTLVKPFDSDYKLLCHKCGCFYRDPVIHILTSCFRVASLRDELWCEIVNIGPIEFSVVLHNMDDTKLALAILSCDSDRFFDLNQDDSEKYSLICVSYIYKMCKNYDC